MVCSPLGRTGNDHRNAPRIATLRPESLAQDPRPSGYPCQGPSRSATGVRRAAWRAARKQPPRQPGHGRSTRLTAAAGSGHKSVVLSQQAFLSADQSRIFVAPSVLTSEWTSLELTRECRNVAGSAILLHILPMPSQCDYNANDRRGERITRAKSLKSTSIQSQPNTRRMADAPDSKSGPRKRVWAQVPPSVLQTHGRRFTR